MANESRLIRVDGDPAAYEAQIRAFIAEARRVNPAVYQAPLERLAARLRASIEADFPDLAQHRRLITEVTGRLNALLLDLSPASIDEIATVQTVLTLALYGQPGDDPMDND
jgi:hypothetical protein